MELINHLAVGLIHGLEPAIQRSIEEDAAIGGQRSAINLEHLLHGPFRLAGHLIECDQPATDTSFSGKHAQRRADIRESTPVLDAECLVIHADVIGAYIEQFGLGIIGSRLVILGALSGRTDAFDVDILGGHFVGIQYRTAGLQVDFLGPIGGRIEFVRLEKLAVAPVQHVSKAIAIEMRERRDRRYRRPRCR